MKKIIVRNEIECLVCGDVIESTHAHDFKMCKCGLVGVDGGKDYLKRVGKEKDYNDLSIQTENMTYRELRDQLNKLTDKQLDFDVVVFDARHEALYISVLKVHEKKEDGRNINDLLDNGHPYIEINTWEI